MKLRPADPDALGPRFQLPDNHVVTGITGTGKSHFIKHTLLADVPRFACFDILGGFVKPEGDYQGAIPVYVEELLDRPYLLSGDRIRIAVLTDKEDNERMAEDCRTFIRLCRATGRMVVVLDELGDYSERCREDLERLARHGRHDGLVPVFASQSAVDVPLKVRRNACRAYSFFQSYPADKDALEECYGAEFRAQVEGWKERDPPAEWVLPTRR